MNHEPIETLVKAPLCAEIYQDEHYDSPSEWGDTDVFLVGFHPNFSVEAEGFSKEVCEMIGEKPKDIYDESIWERVAQIKREYHVFGLEAYIHSGVVLALSREGTFPDRQWDVSQLGLVFVLKEAFKTKSEARKAALSLIETWNQNLSGDVYGYVIREEGEEDWCDSLWGIYGIEDAREQAQEALDYAWKARMAKHEAKKKAEIKNRVPLEKRTHINV